jgi:hypothetical protein
MTELKNVDPEDIGNALLKLENLLVLSTLIMPFSMQPFSAGYATLFAPAFILGTRTIAARNGRFIWSGNP